MIAPDAGDGELKRGHIDKHISAVLAQLAVFVIGKLPIIVARVLSGREHIHDFGRPDRHHRLQQHAIDQRENGRVNADRQRERQYRYGRESRRLEKLPHSKPEILHHKDPSLFSLRCSLPRLWIQQLCVGGDNFLSQRFLLSIAQRRYANRPGHDRPAR